MISRIPETATPRFLVITDVDSTLIQNEVIDLLAEHQGKGDQVAEITEQAMAGQLDFGTSLKLRCALLSGLSEQVLKEVSNQIQPTKGAEALISAVHERGGIIGAVSGGFHEVFDSVAEQLKLDFWLANKFEAIDGILTGKLSGEIVDANAKARTMVELANRFNIPIARTIAVGDGANDIPMIQQSGLGVAFCAKETLKMHANLCLELAELDQLIAVLPR